MAQASISSIEPTTMPDDMISTIINSLRQMSPERVKDVFDFVQTFESRIISQNDVAEDVSLWQAVEANQQYKLENPDEPLERYSSGKEFLQAMADL